MAEQAIILIPDISGFTGFTSATEIDHAAHIITELLELIVAANETDLVLAEIEGDAVLFYRKGEPLRREQVVNQCLRMFSSFHRQLMLIERERVCQCGACQTATNLSLKFIVHFGYIKEIKVAQFVKATGIDMILAHRLLKNDVGSDEYILMTAPCCAVVGHAEADPGLRWARSSQTYEGIGDVGYEFATLTGFKAQISRPPPGPGFVVEKGDDNLDVVIAAPLRAVYQTLVNVDKRAAWLAGVDRSMTVEPIRMHHSCVVSGMTLLVTAAFHDFSERHARYSERVEIPAIGATLASHYDMQAPDAAGTRLTFNINWMNAKLSAAQKQGLLAEHAANLQRFKHLCESDPA